MLPRLGEVKQIEPRLKNLMLFKNPITLQFASLLLNCIKYFRRNASTTKAGAAIYFVLIHIHMHMTAL